FLGEIPPGTGAAYVVIVHLEPTHTSELAEILARKAHIPVSQVNTKLTLEPDNIYVIPPNRGLLITDHEIATYTFDEPRGRRSPIDQFFRSLADQHGDGFAVVLTGAGSDGTVGAKAIKEAGGLILVQDPNDAEYPSMPRSAIATGLADVVLPVRELARQLVELIKNKAHLPADILAPSDEDTLRRILTYLLSRTGHDFLRYKRSTIYRRLARRMQICRVESPSEYFNLIKRKPEELQNLFHDLLISVTTFFRDPAAFEALAQKVVPKLYDIGESEGPLRVWVPGCASGEEAYSIAMLFADEAARRGIRRELQIFASDLDSHALAIAREGYYPLAIESDVGEERLRKYFTKASDQYVIRREIRDLIVFATHSLLKDPPFSRLHLVSCRNLLIYLEKDLQQHVIATFNCALKPGGYLFLGTSESAEYSPGIFSAVDREAKIYQAIGRPLGTKEFRHLPITPRAGEIPLLTPPAPGATASPPASHQQALETAAPPSILVNISHQIVNMSENAGRFFRPSGGQMRNDITELVRPELRFDLRAALHRAFERNQSSLTLPIPVQFNGAAHRVFLQVRPVNSGHGTARHALIFFLEGDAIEPAEPVTSQDEMTRASEEVLRGLKEELELTRSRLRASGEEYEAANEELRAANEELQSINEEYHSTAEELETSKEELQSINEELQTVNAELKSKLESVSRTNNDLQNLMAATDVGTLFLDSQLRIKLFTPKMAEIYNIKAADEGRPVTDLTHKLDYGHFAEDAQTVLKDLALVEREIRAGASWYLTRMRPYRTIDNRIEGVVCTFVDITARLETEQALKAGEARLRLLLSELSHRVKNTLAVVQSMARQSFGPDVSREKGLEIFSDRLRALAEAHNLLVSTDWRGADFRELLERQISPYAKIDSQRVSLQGPAVVMPPSVATPFALMLHELATNALKYGALSSEAGTLRVEWGLKGVEGKREFQFSWRESGGPAVQPPSKEGFGSWLIQNGLAD
ncbi:MAG: CheR family methyltransferase, partial [Rhodomicrobium sp.]